MTTYVLGTGRFARELRSYLVSAMPPHVVVLVEAGKSYPLEGRSIMGSGYPQIKARMRGEIRGALATFVHSRAWVSIDAMVSGGCVVAPGAVVAPFARIGEHVLVNYGACVGHDAIVGALSTVSPLAAVNGGCQLGEGVYVCAGAVMKEGVSIGEGSIVGMGAVVLNDVPDHSIAVGNPARVFPTRSWPQIAPRLSARLREEVQSLLVDSEESTGG